MYVQGESLKTVAVFLPRLSNSPITKGELKTMKIGIVVTSLFSAAALSACMPTKYTIGAVAQEGQTLRYDRGVATVMSTGEAAAMRLGPAETTVEHQMRFNLGVVNLGSEPANVGVENIRVYQASGQPIGVFTFEELKANEEAVAALVSGMMMLAGVAEAANASSDAKVTITGPRGRSSVVTIRDPSGQALARNASLANTNAALNQINAALDEAISDLEYSILQTTTIDPGDSLGAQFVTRAPSFEEGEETAIRVIVEFAGETHEFRFNLTPSP